VPATETRVLRITWIGHSTVLLELDGVRLLTDPVLRGRIVHLRRVAGPAQIESLGNLDAALVSHLHYDHLDTRSLRRLGRSLRVVVPAGGGPLLRRRGLRRVTEIEVGGEVEIGAVTVRATHADHDGRRGPFAKAAAVGYLVTGSARVYFAGDTDLFDGMTELSAGLDVALLPVAGWGPTLPPGHMDPESAAQALALIHPRVAVPIHWGTYRRIGLDGEESLLREPAETFARLASELAPEVDVRILPVGGRLELAVPTDGAASAVTGQHVGAGS
jgi:L-ascorbate metabolism protein UlaG (beta-lactamase superfamily)